MKLYVVRHGTTDINAKYLINGINEIDINEQGKQEAQVVALALSDVKFDAIYCSPLKRCKHTAQIIVQDPDLIVYEDRLKERDAGSMMFRDESELNEELWYRLTDEPIYNDVEPYNSFLKKVHSFLDDLREKHKDHEDAVLLVTHGGVMRAIEIYLYGYPGVEELKKWDHSNCSIRQYIL